MVKADLARDYYGDLDLPPTADVAEIKKQFKKLGTYSLSQSFSLFILFAVPYSNHQIYLLSIIATEYHSNNLIASLVYTFY